MVLLDDPGLKLKKKVRRAMGHLRECFGYLWQAYRCTANCHEHDEASPRALLDLLIGCQGFVKRPTLYEIQRLFSRPHRLTRLNTAPDQLGEVHRMAFVVWCHALCSPDWLDSVRGPIVGMFATLRQWYSVFDPDGDGQCNLEELASTFSEMHQPVATEALRSSLYRSGLPWRVTGVDFEAFVCFVTRGLDSPAQTAFERAIGQMEATFRIFDRDGSGSVDRQELFVVMRCLGLKPTTKQIDSLVKSTAMAPDGELRFAEFTRMVVGPGSPMKSLLQGQVTPQKRAMNLKQT